MLLTSIRISRLAYFPMLLFACVMASSPSFAQAPNILGIQIGMTPAQVATALKAFDPTIRISQLDNFTIDGSRDSVVRQSSSDRILVTLSPLPGSPHVLAISRASIILEPIAIPSVLKSLQDKYGPPMVVRSGLSADYFWFFDAANKPVTPPAVAANNNGLYCKGKWDKSLSQVVHDYALVMGPRVNKANWEDFVGIKEKCGTVLGLTFVPTNNPALATGFNMQIIDHVSYMRAILAGLAYSADQQRQNNERDLTRARQGKQPSL